MACAVPLYDMAQTPKDTNYEMADITPEQIAITELAETVKELVRLIQTLAPKMADHVRRRLDDVYKKASQAKNRMDV